MNLKTRNLILFWCVIDKVYIQCDFYFNVSALILSLLTNLKIIWFGITKQNCWKIVFQLFFKFLLFWKTANLKEFLNLYFDKFNA